MNKKTNSNFDQETDQFLETAIQAARKAGKIQHSYKYEDYSTRRKDLNDIVTEVDLLCEKAIMSEITSRFPGHGFKSEETVTEINSLKEYIWVIDPLDGTINYSSLMPFYSVSLALQKNGETILGVIFSNEFNELYTVVKNKGAFLNGTPLHVSSRAELKDSVFSFMMTSHYSDEHRKKIIGLIDKVSPHVRGLRLFVSQALELAYIATGKLDGHICIKSRGFSAAAGVLLLREAGGHITDIFGNEFGNNAQSLIASNGILHDKIMNIVRDVPK
ncbi:MAG: inositol monophosphatase family protein [Minisyncoccia bacterium]